MRTIIFAGLFHEDKNPSPETVGELSGKFSDINSVAEKQGEAILTAFGIFNNPTGRDSFLSKNIL
ncbi:hypothetical protein [Thermincola ferriacetica]|uniref:hypothetical protein n=1 Tax=Thermincola ferriacetica TaxID=281456 RepID=UPI00068A2C04|nr:hypothetical protein [Thermincola ferriacetica]